MRVNIYSSADEYGEGAGQLIGWFNPESSQRFDQAREWDGNNMVGVITRSQFTDQYLYRTAGGRWVLNHDARNEYNGPDYYMFVSNDEARVWLLRNNLNDVVEEFFGPLEEESGPEQA